KGENIWDRYTHDHPYFILDGQNGDIACDSYHHYKTDMTLMKHLDVDFYRFSLSWSRILPTGFAYQVNPDGIRYYNDVINHCIENDVIPIVTMFHWDTPQPLQDLGGFANELMVDWFEDYARVVYENFGDRVKMWLTFNEPRQICYEGVGNNDKAPGSNSSGIGDYLCSHNLIKAHARAYHLYDKEFRHKQHGKVSITIDGENTWPATNSTADKEAAERIMAFTFGWYTDPIYHPNGDYPEVMKKFVAERSKKEGFKKSRLPEFTKEEVEYIKGTYDFFGLNHYTTVEVADIPDPPIGGKPSLFTDARATVGYNPSWPSTSAPWLKIVPWGFTSVLKWIKDRYGDVPIYVTENGYADNTEKLDDQGRIDFHTQYLSALLDAIYDHQVNVKAYTVWSLFDNFEWRDGFVTRFGLYDVDYDHPDRIRTPKASSEFFKKVIATRRIV
ncbi:hypothetical protein ILUMI_12035, partial [Ignelater luminosus]